MAKTFVDEALSELLLASAGIDSAITTLKNVQALLKITPIDRTDAVKSLLSMAVRYADENSTPLSDVEWDILEMHGCLQDPSVRLHLESRRLRK